MMDRTYKFTFWTVWFLVMLGVLRGCQRDHDISALTQNVSALQAQLSTHVETPHAAEAAAPDMTAYDTRMDTIEKHQLAILAVLDLASRNDETLDKRDQEFLAIILIIQKELIEQRALIEKLSDTTPSYVEKD